MPTQNIIEEFGVIAREHIIPESRTHQALADYKWQLSAVCSLIRHTHTIVVRKLESIEAADSLDAARGTVRELEGLPLTEAFRAQGLCDVFEGFGHSLLRLVETHGSSNQPPVARSLPDTQRYELYRLCEILIGRERLVADLYAEQIQEISDLVHDAPRKGLAEVNALAATARTALVHQMHDLDALSREFERITVG